MDKKWEVAKNQGLNWKALAIEETQTKIKILMKDMILRLQPTNKVRKAVEKLISGLIVDIDDDRLTLQIQSALTQYMNRLFIYYQLTFAGVSAAGINALWKVANRVENSKERAIVEHFFQRDMYRLYNRAVPLEIYSKDYMRMVNERLNYLAEIEPKADYSNRVTLRNIAEIQVRADHHTEEINKLVADGEDLVWIIPHSNASERCEPWQGKLYSLSGKYGNIDGISYQPLSNATDVFETTRTGKVYKNGCISGFNCRHKLEPYRKGTKIIKIPAEVVEKERKINDTQRYMERNIRVWKEKALIFKDISPELYVNARERAKEWNNRYIEFSRKNKVAFYPDRTKLL